ncbi:anaerobic ribonucleoside-triphosphate reductase, partial [bacterium]|nr:anaerobic ribonucleoside-triphosphate reductase [bacterium]
LEGMDYKTLKQEAQHLIFSGSQSAFSRGGQTLFLDFNIHSGVPRYLKDVPAIGPGGKETGKTYGDYAEVASQFARAMLDVWRAGDQHGHIFAFPKCDFHINDETFTDPDQFELYEYACQVASENGVPYFIFDRDEVTLSACCRLRTTIEDTSMLRHLETMRFCGFQNVTINLPQAAYRAGKGNVDEFLKDVEGGMDIAVQAHMEKRVFIKKLMSAPHMPLWQIGKEAKDGKPYVDLDKATYIIGLVGLNEAVQHLSGEELHESTAALKLGLKIISFMYFKAKQEGKRTGLKMTLEESPAESATRRMAKVDLRNYPAAREVIKGNIERDEFYYTNSIHLRADANIDILTRIRTQAKFHPLIESGAIIHAFVGEELPSTASIMSLVRKTFEQTQAAQLTISPEFTVCRTCHERNTGLQDACTICESDDVFSMTRIVGYYSRISNWNKSKIGELRDRQAGTYALAEAGSVTRRKSAEPATQNATV